MVVAGASPAPLEASAETLAAWVAVREDAGQTRKDAIAAVALAAGVAKRLVFDAVVAAKGQPLNH